MHQGVGEEKRVGVAINPATPAGRPRRHHAGTFDPGAGHDREPPGIRASAFPPRARSRRSPGAREMIDRIQAGMRASRVDGGHRCDDRPRWRVGRGSRCAGPPDRRFFQRQGRRHRGHEAAAGGRFRVNGEGMSMQLAMIGLGRDGRQHGAGGLIKGRPSVCGCSIMSPAGGSADIWPARRRLRPPRSRTSCRKLEKPRARSG